MITSSAAAKPRADLRTLDDVRERRRDIALSATLLVQVLAMFVLRPLAEMHVVPGGLAQIAQFALGIVAALFVADAGPARTTIVAVAALAVATNALRPIASGAVLPVLSIINFCYGLAVAWIILAAVFGPGRVTVHRIQGAIVLYLDLALMFAQVYAELQFFYRDAFAGHVQAPFGTLLYFSLATLTSAAYGDFVPLHPLARSVANFEAVIGQMFPATLVARLVGLYLYHSAQDRNTSASASASRPASAGEAPGSD